MKFGKTLGFAALAVSFSAAAAPAPGSKLAFDIVQGDKKLGQVTYEFSASGKDLVVARHQAIAMSKMMIKASLDETSSETWSGDKLTHVESQVHLRSTIKDDDASLELNLGADGKLAGKTNKGPLSLPAGAQLFTLWRAASLQDGTYFNYGDGKPVTITMGKDPVTEKAPERTPADCTAKDATVLDSEGHTAHALVWQKGGNVCSVRFNGPGGVFDYLPAQ